MSSVNLDKCKRDLIMIRSHTIQQIPCPYSYTDAWDVSILQVYQKYRQEMCHHNRVMTIVYGYYLGELLNFTSTPREKWLEFVHTQHIRREYHYYSGISRIFKLFQENVEQIYRTSYLSHRMIVNMRSSDYNELLNYSRTINELVISGTL
jgi:hypothetical protein